MHQRRLQTRQLIKRFHQLPKQSPSHLLAHPSVLRQVVIEVTASSLRHDDEVAACEGVGTGGIQSCVVMEDAEEGGVCGAAKASELLLVVL